MTLKENQDDPVETNDWLNQEDDDIGDGENKKETMIVNPTYVRERIDVSF